MSWHYYNSWLVQKYNIFTECSSYPRGLPCKLASQESLSVPDMTDWDPPAALLSRSYLLEHLLQEVWIQTAIWCRCKNKNPGVLPETQIHITSTVLSTGKNSNCKTFSLGLVSIPTMQSSPVGGERNLQSRHLVPEPVLCVNINLTIYSPH